MNLYQITSLISYVRKNELFQKFMAYSLNDGHKIILKIIIFIF